MQILLKSKIEIQKKYLNSKNSIINLINNEKQRKLMMINWQVIGQLVSLGIIVLLGPAVIIVLSFKNTNQLINSYIF